MHCLYVASFVEWNVALFVLCLQRVCAPGSGGCLHKSVGPTVRSCARVHHRHNHLPRGLSVCACVCWLCVYGLAGCAYVCVFLYSCTWSVWLICWATGANWLCARTPRLAYSSRGSPRCAHTYPDTDTQTQPHTHCTLHAHSTCCPLPFVHTHIAGTRQSHDPKPHAASLVSADVCAGGSVLLRSATECDC